jgi:hypothetical protein
MASLLDSLPEAVHRPADLERLLKVDQPLASRVWRLAATREPAKAVALLPTVNQLLGTVVAAEKAGVNPARAAQARRVIARLNDFVRTHTGNVAQFEAMMVQTAGGDGSASEVLRLKHRRTAFKSNSQVWGVHARTTAHCCIFSDCAEGGYESVVVVRGHSGFQSLRPDAPLEIRTRFRFEPGEKDAPKSDPTLPVGVELQPLVLVPGFGVGPAPQIETVEDPGGYQMTRVRLPAIGRSNAATFFVERVARDTMKRDGPVPVFALLTQVTVPTELVQLDLWVPAKWSDPSTIVAGTFACRHTPESSRLCRDSDRIEMNARAEYLGGHITPPPSPDIARWSEVVSHVLGKHGLARRKFDVYRYRVSYPILHSVMRIKVDGVGR